MMIMFVPANPIAKHEETNSKANLLSEGKRFCQKGREYYFLGGGWREGEKK